MLRPTLEINGVSGSGHIASAAVSACLILVWSQPTYSVEPSAAPDEQTHLQLAPIRFETLFGGGLTYTLERSMNGASKSTQQTLTVDVNAGIRANSFIWQPWLAQVTAGLMGGLTTNSMKSNSMATNNTLSSAINGDAALNLVKYSRFPFVARIFRQDSNYSASYSGANFASLTTGYSLTQDYASRNARTKGNASYTSSKTSSPSYSPNYSEMFDLGLSMQPTRTQSISITGSTSSSKIPDKDMGYNRNALIAHHAYQPNSVFSLSSQADLLDMNRFQKQGSNATKTDFKSGQFLSFASWRPQTSPLTMTSSVRIYKTESINNDIAAPAMISSNFNLGANYLFSPLIRLYGAVNVSDYLGTQSVNTNAALTAAKAFTRGTANLTNLGGFRYSQHIGGTIATSDTTILQSTNQTNIQASSLRLNLGVYMGHALDKASQFGSGTLATNLHQTITMGYSPINPTATSRLIISSLLTAGGVAWNRSVDRETTQLRVTASDVRFLSEAHTSSIITQQTQPLQMINLQATRSQAITSQQSLRGNLTLQGTHQEPSGYVQNQTVSTITTSANLDYINLRTFKVRNLKFESFLRISGPNILLSLSSQATRSWENNFTYQIGRLGLRLGTRLTWINHNTISYIKFSMARTF